MAYSLPTRRSTADIIFGQLRDEIMSLEILPGTKLSEAEVAAKFGVSRQPVREALNLLSSEDLVTIQPQKATRVRQFSSAKIATARFVRRAIEVEVLKSACENWSDVCRPGLERCLAAQDRAVKNHDTKEFHALDEEFHALLTEAGQVPFAFEGIKAQKAYVDRICVLSLKNADEMTDLVRDHRLIFNCVSQKDAAGAEAALRVHLARIEKTIEAVRQANSEYFED
jgi:DNA-binding GntR family transcriptional regulator